MQTENTIIYCHCLESLTFLTGNLMTTGTNRFTPIHLALRCAMRKQSMRFRKRCGALKLKPCCLIIPQMLPFAVTYIHINAGLKAVDKARSRGNYLSLAYFEAHERRDFNSTRSNTSLIEWDPVISKLVLHEDTF